MQMKVEWPRLDFIRRTFLLYLVVWLGSGAVSVCAITLWHAPLTTVLVYASLLASIALVFAALRFIYAPDPLKITGIVLAIDAKLDRFVASVLSGVATPIARRSTRQTNHSDSSG